MTYYVYVSAKFNKGYTIDASSKEEAMQKALETSKLKRFYNHN